MHSDLRGHSRVDDELSEISFIDLFLKVLSEGVIVYCEVTHLIMKGIVVS